MVKLDLPGRLSTLCLNKFCNIKSHTHTYYMKYNVLPPVLNGFYVLKSFYKIFCVVF